MRSTALIGCIGGNLPLAGHNPGVNSELRPLAAALTDAELHALITSTYDTHQIVPGFLTWLERIADWEPKRRRGPRMMPVILAQSGHSWTNTWLSASIVAAASKAIGVVEIPPRIPSVTIPGRDC